MESKENDGIPDNSPPLTPIQTILFSLFWGALICIGFGSLLIQLSLQ
ncbi:MAG: hypothetical protein IV106_31215 [Pseudomonas umsongensis]|nr:hypothetical protein [Pseudomonas umsongensis]